MRTKTIKFYTLAESELEHVVQAVVKKVMHDVGDALLPPTSLISALVKESLRDLKAS